MAAFLDAIRVGGIWMLFILMSIGASFAVFLIWYAFVWMKKNPPSIIAILPVCLVPLVCFVASMVGISETEAALASDLVPEDMKAALMARGFSVSLYALLFLKALIPPTVGCILLAAIPALTFDQKDKTLPIICAGCYLVCMVLGGLAVSRSFAGILLIGLAGILMLGSSAATISRSHEGGTTLGFVATLLGASSVAALFISSNAEAYIYILEAAAAAPAELKGTMIAAGQLELRGANTYLAPACGVALLPSLFSLTQQPGRAKIFAVLGLGLVCLCFGVLFLFPDIGAVTQQILDQSLSQ